MAIIGTAGHVDHGKTSLIRALTGIDTDRLKEEKTREMTIDLGFAWLDVPGRTPIGIVDVPGHRDFIENMLAGIGGINAALFVVAADEGIMPQTREHLIIMDLLNIPGGVVALTKTDLVSDPDLLELVQLELADLLKDSTLRDAPIIPVSSRTEEGIDTLKTAILSSLDSLSTANERHIIPRLWIDRAFTVSGFGTVVTGTLIGGGLSLGDEIVILPQGTRGRVRGLQSHHTTLQSAAPGNRVAVNLSGIDREQVRRGMLLTTPEHAPPVQTLTVRYTPVRKPRLSKHPLKHNAEVKLFYGSAEVIARARILDTSPDGQQGNQYVQFELLDPLPTLRGDRLIVRRLSPAETIGGGVIIEVGGRTLRRNRPDTLDRLNVLSDALSRGDPADLIRQALGSRHMITTEIARAAGLHTELVSHVLPDLPDIRRMGAYWISESALADLLARLTNTLAGYHRAEPLRGGMRPELLRSRLKIESDALDALIVAAGDSVKRTHTGLIALPDHTITYTKAQRSAIDRLLRTFAENLYTPPSVKESAAQVGADVLDSLIESGTLIRLNDEVIFAPDAFRAISDEVHRTLAESGAITVRELRDRFETSRKFALAVLEWFDAQGMTRLDGDRHIPA
jgi:selenocysteine-specific elongation factor